MEEKLLKIINHYGVNHQQRKLQEEVFEFQEAIVKYEFAKEDNELQDDLDEPRKWNLYHFNKYILEEIADVQVMLNQFRLYYGITDEEVKNIMIKKIERQLERIKGEIC